MVGQVAKLGGGYTGERLANGFFRIEDRGSGLVSLAAWNGWDAAWVRNGPRVPAEVMEELLRQIDGGGI